MSSNSPDSSGSAVGGWYNKGAGEIDDTNEGTLPPPLVGAEVVEQTHHQGWDSTFMARERERNRRPVRILPDSVVSLTPGGCLGY